MKTELTLNPYPRRSSPWWRKTVLVVLAKALAVGLAAAPTEALSGEEIPPDRVVERQSLRLRHPVEAIYPGTFGTVLGFVPTRQEMQLIDIATGEPKDAQKLEGRPDSVAGYRITPDRWEFLYTQENQGNPLIPHLFGILIVRGETFFSINTFEPTFRGLRLPAAQYIFSRKEANVIAWDRSLPHESSAYTIGGIRKRIEIVPKLYPFDLVDFDNDQYKLAVHPDEGMASMLNVREGYAEDFLSVRDIKTDDPANYASFTPNSSIRGIGTIVIANGEAEVLTVISVIDGSIPQIDTPLQIRIKTLAPLSEGNRRLIVAANRDLSVITVGAVGSAQLAVFRKVGGGLEELQPVTLDYPIKDIVVLPRARTADNEVFAFLRDDGGALFVEPDPKRLISLAPVAIGDQFPEVAFTSLRLEPADIARLQRALVKLGYSIGAIDGIVGRATTSAVRAFQFKVGLTATGVLDDPTRKALNQGLRDRGRLRCGRGRRNLFSRR